MTSSRENPSAAKEGKQDPSPPQAPEADLSAWTEQLAQNLLSVNQRIEEAVAKSGRVPGAVTLLPVTKTIPAERLLPLVDLGYTAFGENRIQEIRGKVQELEGFPISWQMIGRLQTNKAGQVARACDVVQSVDSLRLAQSLSRGAVAADRQLKVLLQVNTSGEETKTGFTPQTVLPALGEVLDLPNLSVGGLMTMAPLTDDLTLVRTTFAGLRETRDKLVKEYGQSAPLPELSMGMSHDFEIAIEEGATLVRIGSAIFGPRETQ